MEWENIIKKIKLKFNIRYQKISSFGLLVFAHNFVCLNNKKYLKSIYQKYLLKSIYLKYLLKSIYIKYLFKSIYIKYLFKSIYLKYLFKSII